MSTETPMEGPASVPDQQPAPPEKVAGRYEFHIWNVDFGRGDHSTEWSAADGSSGKTCDRIEFEIEGRPWILRQTYMVNGCALPLIQPLDCKPGGKMTTVVLQVPADEWNDESAAETAEDICWLLELALGQSAAWSDVYKVADGDRVCLRRLSRSFQPGTPQQRPLVNCCDGRLSRFLESAYPLYRKDRPWWRITIHWFTVASCACPMEAGAMVYAMMLERIADFAFDPLMIPKKIGDDLALALSDLDGRRKKMTGAISAVMAIFCENWIAENTTDVLEEIGRRNNNLTFKSKVRSALNLKNGLGPNSKLLEERNALVHEGNSREMSIEESLPKLAQFVTLGLLKILGYQGHFFTRVVGQLDTQSFLPQQAGIEHIK